jgi:hypothetical protein
MSSVAPLLFAPVETIQRYVVPATGHYVIEAAGAQGGAGGGGPGGKGARVKGTFHLTRDEILWIVVGQPGGAGNTPHQPAGGGGGGTFVWKSMADLILPSQPMLAAGGGGGGTSGAGSDAVVSMDAAPGAVPGGRNGHGGGADVVNFHYSGGGGTGWKSGGGTGSTPTYCGGGHHWAGGAGADYCCNVGGAGGFGGGGGGAFIGHGSGGGGGYSGGGGGTQNGPGGGGGGSFNAGTHQLNLAGIQTGPGYVSLLAMPDLAAVRLQNSHLATRSPLPLAAELAAAGDTAQRGPARGEFRGYF